MESCDCVPTEDAVQALVDFLVSPLLPSKSFFSPDSPSEDLQERVAKQVHAVILLYNYYHRKQFPLLEFLDFKSFCQMTTIAMPNLIPYMKAMLAPNDSLKLSILENMIDEACGISASLEMSIDAESLKTWPVSKVAVFLVDQTHRFCFLESSSSTCGRWSMIEKNIDMTVQSMEKIGSLPDEDNYLLKFAIQAVKEKTGLVGEELTVLERDAAYSLSKQKTAVQFYLMEYHGTSIEEFTKCTVKDVINSLQAPLFRKDLSPLPAVDFFHLLPYQSILSGWLFRQDTLLDSDRELGDNLHQEVKSSEISHDPCDGCQASIVVTKRRSRRLEQAQKHIGGPHLEISSDEGGRESYDTLLGDNSQQELKSFETSHEPCDGCKASIVITKRRSRRLERAQQQIGGPHQEIRSEEGGCEPHDRRKMRITVAIRRSRRLQEAQERNRHL